VRVGSIWSLPVRSLKPATAIRSGSAIPWRKARHQRALRKVVVAEKGGIQIGLRREHLLKHLAAQRQR